MLEGMDACIVQAIQTNLELSIQQLLGVAPSPLRREMVAIALESLALKLRVNHAVQHEAN